MELDRVSQLGFDADLTRVRELEKASGLDLEKLKDARVYAFSNWAQRNEDRVFKLSDLAEATRALEFTQQLGPPKLESEAATVSFVIAKFADSGFPIDFGLVELPLWKNERPVFEIDATLLRPDLKIDVIKRGNSYTTNESHVLKMVDRGVLTITSERVVFIGQHSGNEISRDQLLDLNGENYDLKLFLRYGSDPVIFRTIAPAPSLQSMVAFMARGEMNDPESVGEAWSRVKDMGRAVRRLRRLSSD